MTTEEEKLKHWKRRHNHIAKDLRTEKYRQRVVEVKREKKIRLSDLRNGYLNDGDSD